MIVLLVLSLLALYIFVSKFLQLRAAGREDKYFVERIKDYVLEGKTPSAIKLCEDTNTPYARMIRKGLTRIGRPMSDVLVIVENAGNIEIGRLEKGLPILATIAAGAPVIMVSSATYSLIDPSAPAVFSSTIVTDMLRTQMGFSGVVITDDVSAAVQVQDVSAGDRAVRAIRAGCDLVLASADPTVAADMVKALIATARSDPAFAARVDESATRVLNLKKSLQS